MSPASENRINSLDMTALDVIQALAEGNPGALSTCVEAMKHTVEIDPDCAWGELGPLISLDSFGIYGSDIYVFFNDICKRNIEQFLGVLRACQLGIHSIAKVRDTIDYHQRRNKTIFPDWKPEDVLAMVKERLPHFGVKETCETSS